MVASSLLLVPVVAILGLSVLLRFSRRLSPSLPYAGESSIASRLSTPILYGKNPVGFLCETRKSLGDVFCVDLIVTKIVFILGPEGNKDVLKATEDQLSFWKQIEWALGPLVEKGAWTRLISKDHGLLGRRLLETITDEIHAIQVTHFLTGPQ